MNKIIKNIAIGLIGVILILLIVIVAFIIYLKLDITDIISNKIMDEIILDTPYKTIDNRQLSLDIHKPRRIIFTKSPVVFMFHGGSWDSGNKTLKDDDVLSYLLDYGITVVCVEYRLTDSETIFPAHVDDCADAIRFIADNAKLYGVDNSRFCVLGASAGGQLSLLLALAGSEYGNVEQNDSKLPIRCAVSLCGPTDFLNLEGYGEEERKQVNELLLNLFGGAVSEKEELYKEASPINRLRRDAPPIFLAHGKADPVVQFVQAETFYNAATEIRMNITYVPVENANHKFQPVGDEPISPSIDEILKKLTIFLVKYLIF